MLELARGYGVQRILGFRYGYEGLISRFGHVPLALTPESVTHIHHQGGTILGTSRGEQDPAEIVDCLEANGIGILFVIGGDGTIRGAMQIAAEVERRGLKIAVVGIPKTIDNDIQFIDRSFGFETAYSAAVDVDPQRARRGDGRARRHRAREADGPALGLHRLPRRARVDGRRPRADSRGADARSRASAGSSRSLDRVLAAQGPRGDRRRRGRRPGRSWRTRGRRRDRQERQRPARRTSASFLRERIIAHFGARGREVTLKYIDPSYTIRSVPATPVGQRLLLEHGAQRRPRGAWPATPRC